MGISSVLRNRIALPFSILRNDAKNGHIGLGVVEGLSVAFKGSRVYEPLINKKHDIIIKRLKKEFSYVLDKYAEEPAGHCSYSADSPIWVSWTQGLDKAPELVKKCVASVSRASVHPMIFIDSESMKRYTRLPDYIYEKVGSGAITMAQLSDIIRFNLLSLHGGVWIDATAFVPNRIPEEIFQKEIFTCKREPRGGGFVSNYQWTSFVMGCQKGSLFPKLVNELFLEYWKKKDYLIDYLLVDYFIKIACECVPKVKKTMDIIPYNNSRIDELQSLFDEEYSDEKLASLKSSDDTFIYKLSWRMPFVEQTLDGKQTFYGKFMSPEGL